MADTVIMDWKSWQYNGEKWDFGKFSCGKQESSKGNIVFYDTFDWRFYSNSYTIYRLNDVYYLKNISSLHPEDSFASPTEFTLLEDCPDDSFRARIASLLDIRALIPVLNASYQKTQFHLLNHRQKIIARLQKETFADKDSQISFLFLSPLKGYKKEFKKISHSINSWSGSEPIDDYMATALMHYGVQPKSYSSKFKLSLSPQSPALTATQEILSNLYNHLKINEPYLAQDLDTEFLHDFRVSIRRARSAISQIKGVFNEDQTLLLKNRLAALGKLSNELRDLDVYLLKEDEYKGLVPDSLKKDIEPLFTYLQEKRKTAFHHFIHSIQSKQYQDILQDWQNAIQKKENEIGGENADLDILLLARKRIYKIYRKIIRSGSEILKDSQDEYLHSLRIECKKLRYLLEFFNSLFPGQEVDYLIKKLKKLQNNLGDFNDLDVQKIYLEQIALEIPIDNPPQRKTILAIGALVVVLDRKQQQVKNEFSQVFIEFADKQNQDLFKKLIKK